MFTFHPKVMFKSKRVARASIDDAEYPISRRPAEVPSKIGEINSFPDGDYLYRSISTGLVL